MASVQSNVDWQSTKNSILERNRHMFNNPDMSDINFTCEGSDKTFYAHKYVLGTSSAVFHAMFYGKLAVKDSTVHLSDTNEESMEQFLRFLYTEECTLTVDNVIAIMYLAKKYTLHSLDRKCLQFLLDNLNPENVLDVLEKTSCFGEKKLEECCWRVIERETSKVVASDNFTNITPTTLGILLKVDKLNVQEVELFQAVLKWIDSQCSSKNIEPTAENRRSVIGEAIYYFRFFSMSHEQFVQNVSKSGLLTSDEMIPIYERFLGFDWPVLKWKLSKRKSQNLVRFSRFPKAVEDYLFYDWGYTRTEDRLCLSVDKEVSLHGVRLFGANNGSEYQVTFKVKESKVQGTYISELNQNGVPGFDVMLKKPVTLIKDEVVTLSATIKGPHLVRCENGVTKIAVEGVSVTFIDAARPNNGTSTKAGQFYDIILAI